MVCIELSRNGQRLAVAGIPGNGVVFAHVASLAKGEGPPGCKFSLHGLEMSGSDKWSLEWAHGPAVVGDEFTLRVLELEQADPPSSREGFERPEQVRRDSLAHLERIEAEAQRLREELGLPPR